MKKVLLFCGCLLPLLAASVVAAQQQQYRGKLDPELSMTGSTILEMKPAPAEIIAKLPTAPAKGDQVFFYIMETEPGGDALLVVVVQTYKGERYLYYDLNYDGRFEARERFSFPESGVIDTKVPLSAGIITSMPVRFRYQEYKEYPQLYNRPDVQSAPSEKRADTKAKQEPVPESAAPQLRRTLLSTIGRTATGMVDIDGQKTLVRYPFNTKKNNIDITETGQAMDCNGNGKIDGFGSGFVEIALAKALTKGRSPVFRIGTHYVATKSVNINTGEIVLEERPASDYTRIELSAGSQIPDFPYKDMDGKPRQLSDFRGKYLLLNFWGSW